MHDLRTLDPDAKFSPQHDRSANHLAVMLRALLDGPALAAGALLCWRAIMAFAS
jgi:hypothetical protein